MCPTKALKIIYKSFSNVYFNGGYLKKSKVTEKLAFKILS